MKITAVDGKIKRERTGRRLEEKGAKCDASLLYLYSNNSIENPKKTPDDLLNDQVRSLSSLLTPYHKKQAESLYLNVSRLITKEAISPNHVGFLTLTFPDNVTDYKEASKRFDSLNTNFLSKKKDFGNWILTAEQQKRGAWHFHLLICLDQDVKTGVNFDEFKKGRYTSGSPYLRNIWKELREAMPKYKFGRSEMLPVRENAEAMGRYIGKYISKHIGQRDESSKGARLVRYSQGWAKNSMKFGWNTENAQLWREKLSIFASLHGCTEFYQLADVLGSNWAYRYAEEIFSIIPLEYKINGLPEKEYRPKILGKIEANKKQTLKDQKSPFPTDRRKRERKKQKAKNTVESAKTGMKEYYGEDFTALLAHEAELEGGDRALKSAYQNKSYVHDREKLEIPLNTQPIEVPF